ncbi:hypothetical protein CEUSTIGMA_g10354.t1 [Chlamydomonas eustigma]|uniref:Uncharacterized protein n=1 Tax=Chlamydomonas eustigma TaxID=1157962 RepID=A0A250XIL6_9CHLO|nr:hypothetical protein CEUSTIGMA_g10354.t1 [Chlamydomonas eustigma]|eukprot:GAX82927.1 hypothetical protein CEUSTIGMA_g10354.t1 [Chlamydomonas eustigma]
MPWMIPSAQPFRRILYLSILTFILQILTSSCGGSSAQRLSVQTQPIQRSLLPFSRNSRDLLLSYPTSTTVTEGSVIAYLPSSAFEAWCQSDSACSASNS